MLWLIQLLSVVMIAITMIFTSYLQHTSNFTTRTFICKINSKIFKHIQYYYNNCGNNNNNKNKNKRLLNYINNLTTRRINSCLMVCFISGARIMALKLYMMLVAMSIKFYLILLDALRVT